MAYHLLSEPIRKYIRQKRWPALRPIQAAAITKIIQTEHNYILASRTASGKTEAAFLPILSKADFKAPGVQVLYISPLVALINDQFYRVEDLCQDLEISVTKWHGEAKRSLKNQLIKNPNGVVLITPESLEALFVHAPYNMSALFGHLQYLVIDEIHAFLGVDRGLQLMSLLSRIQQINPKKIVTIGLSATIGDDNYQAAKRLTGDVEGTKILLDRSQKETEAQFRYFDNQTVELPLDLLKDLYKATAAHKVLIFPNSRGRTEEIAVKLRKISNRVKGHPFYYAHHASVDKDIRERIEHFAKNNQRFNFCIACTSTLELGIDIGTVDKIVQIDATHSVAALLQRIGRSGRREGEKSLVHLYATSPWSLLQSLACWKLSQTGFLEPIQTAQKPFDILFHQLLSVVKQLSGCRRTELLQRLQNNPTFAAITPNAINALLDHCLQQDYLEQIGPELILGLAGEALVNGRSFYSVFQTEPIFKVLHKGKKIGELPHSAQVNVDENILLAAKIWKVRDIDFKGSKISVIPAKDGQKPRFAGRGGHIHQRVREEMFRILKSQDQYPELDAPSQTALAELRDAFKGFEVDDFQWDCPVVEREEKLVWYTFTSSAINKSLYFLITLTGKNCHLNEQSSSLELDLDAAGLEQLVQTIQQQYQQIDQHLRDKLEVNSALMEFAKWGSYLPLDQQVALLKERYYDFEGAMALLQHMTLLEATA